MGKATELARANKKQSDYENEQIEARRMARDFNLQEEYRLIAQTQRMQAAQEDYEKGATFFLQGAGKIDAARAKREADKLARDLKMNNALYDVFYKSQAEAHERQKQSVMNELKGQSSALAKRRLIDGQIKEMELRKVTESYNQGEGADKENQKARRSEERQVVGLEKRPSLAKSQSMPSRGPSSKPWVDITRPQALGGPVGCFAGEGGTSIISLKATGGLRRILT